MLRDTLVDSSLNILSSTQSVTYFWMSHNDSFTNDEKYKTDIDSGPFKHQFKVYISDSQSILRGPLVVREPL